jgi:hypothetical protein
MSYDLTIKSDDLYSQSKPLTTLERLIARLPGVKRNGKRGFALDDRPKRWMEIDLEAVNEEGDNIEDDGKPHPDVNCIRLHIPYKFLGDAMDRDYLPTALAIAKHAGWTLYDDQTDEPVQSTAVPPKKGAVRSTKKFDRKKFIGKWVHFPYEFAPAYRMEFDLLEDGRFEMNMFDEQGAFQGGTAGTWEVSGDTTTWTHRTAKKLPVPRHPEINKVLHLSKNHFTILDPKRGEKAECWRVLANREFSTSLGASELRDWLEWLADVVGGGFGGALGGQIARLTAMASDLETGQSCLLYFRVTLKEIDSAFPIQVTMAANKTLNITFSAPMPVAKKIEAGMKASVARTGG